MLVFISDLHFVDETAGKHNLPASAFGKFLSSIKIHADKAAAEEVKIIFLGDVFDLLRTEAWFDTSEEDRPWGKNTAAMKQKAASILSKIGQKNKRTFDLFKRDSLQKIFGNVNVETIYIPGNHDRLCALVPALKDKVTILLGLDKNNKEDNFKYTFARPEYGVFALHGHCFDRYNYEGGEGRTPRDYSLVPIGDPITTELIAKLPHKLMKKMKKAKLDSKEETNLKRNFQEIENVRPFSATLKWLLYQVDANRHLKEIIEDTIDEVAQEFEQLQFVKQWYKRHDKWLNMFDSADQIQGVLFFMRHFKVLSTGRLMDMAKKIAELGGDDENAKGAMEYFSELDSRIQYIVMGHTHDPLKKALGLRAEGGQPREQVYINTGTWRKRYHECTSGKGFIGWKDMTYVMIYTPKEKPNRHNMPVFETWTGSEKRDEV